jgi:protein gp37
MRMAARIEAMGTAPHYAGTTRRVRGKAVWSGKLALAPNNVLQAPLRRRRATTWFVNSMGDLFHEDCPDEWIDLVFDVMAQASDHTFQVLTKRALRMRDYLRNKDRQPLANVWLGVSTERQKEADERIPLLLQTPAAVRFISAEPLLGALNIKAYVGRRRNRPLDWVIVGGESGPRARPMNPDWVNSLRDQCETSSAKFFFKQWGGKNKKAAGRLLNGRTYDDMPASPIGIA